MKKLFLMAVMAMMTISAMAQRTMDKLDRGLVAIKTDAGVFCSWRIFGEEYYDVKYNIYRDGTKLNAEPLSVSNFVDAAGTASSKYTVSAVVRNVEQAQCSAASVWAQSWLEITPDHSGLKSTYVPNDACMADVDGDGEQEILMKFDNQDEIANCMQREGYFGEYSIFKVFKLDGTLLWWVNCGPNMGDFQNNEQNIVAYDWDQDGKAEAVMRLEEGSVIHMADGTTYSIGADGQNGSAWTNYREPSYVSNTGATVKVAFGLSASATASCPANWVTTSISDGILYVKANSHSGENARSTTVTVNDGNDVKTYFFGQKGSKTGVEWFTHYGNEFLVYCNGETGAPYVVTEFPLKRLENGETDLSAAWGDGYGHRSSKYFFGAPYLDGRHPSIFLARGIYTRHKMIALDVDPATHKLTERWRWNNNTPGSPWYGQGYHNYAIADVDWDGRDEICFGSMVIDDNGKGLSTTGLGHGDAQHHGDFNPYIHGHEIYTCNEDNPDNNYRDATTSKIYYRQTSSKDDGRSMMGNFSNDYPGCLGRSGHDTAISSVTNDHIPQDIAFDVNFRIYWDGDLLEETFNGTGTRNSAGRIYKPTTGNTIATLTGSLTNNDTKAAPCYQGDILGDWREEVMMRTADNKIRIYTTTIPTEWRNYTLWHDMQYRQAMVWQMCGYNQPPHVSYFLGELEGITMAPPALTMTGRIEVKDGGEIGEVNTPNPHWLLAETQDATVHVQDGCQPYIVTVNTPSWVQGHDNNDNIEYTYYTHTLTGGAFAGDMRLVKQGDGKLILPNVTETYSGPTDVWAGTLQFDGTMQNSTVWLNRFAALESDGGKFKMITMDYASELRPGGNGKAGSIEAEEIGMGFGSRIVFDVMSDGSADCVKANRLSIEKKDWQYGPKYTTPVFEIVRQGALAEGKYLLVDVSEVLTNSLDDIVLEGIDGLKASLIQEAGKIYLNVESQRAASSVVWNGGEDGIWDFANTENFISAEGNKDIFVTGDEVTFGDEATQTNVIIKEDVSPKSVVFQNETKNYTLSGEGSIIGDASLTKDGTGKLTITNTNKLTGGVIISEGTLEVSALANADGSEYGALGGVDNTITLESEGALAIKDNVVTTQKLSFANGGGTIDVSSGKKFTANGNMSQSGKSSLRKEGNGTLIIGGSVKLDTLVINKGIVQGGEIGDIHQYPSVIVLNGGSLKDPDDIYSYSTNRATVMVPEGKTAIWTLDARCNYTGRLLGGGALTVNVTSVRSAMQGDWSEFNGTLNFAKIKTGSYDPQIQWNNSKGLGNATVTGDFHNNGKNVTIGTLSDKVTLSGDGRYFVLHIAPVITRGRGNNGNSFIEVANTLIVTEDIVITLKGTNNLKAGEVFEFWTCKKFESYNNVTVTMPELPEGLYWDTTELLTKNGRLKVTDVPPTGIRDVMSEERGVMSEKWFTIDGRLIDGVPTKKGLYIKNGKKVVVK